MNWNPFRRNAVETPKQVRIQVEELLESGMLSAEVAEELNISIEKVYNIKNAQSRRVLEIKKKAVVVGNSLEELKIELAEVKLKEAIDKATFDAEERKEAREGDFVEEVLEGGNEEGLLISLLTKALSGNQGQPVVVQGESVRQNSPQEQTLSPEATNAISQQEQMAQDIPKLISAIKGGVVSEAVFIERAKPFSFTEKQSKALYNFIRRKL